LGEDRGYVLLGEGPEVHYRGEVEGGLEGKKPRETVAYRK